MWMRVEKVPVSEAAGHILLHNQVGPDGRKRLKKGHRLVESDLPTLQSLELDQVYVAIMEAGDVGENEAARRLGELVAGPGVSPTSATTGRVNLLAQTPGLVKIDVDALLEFNECAGITLGTIPTNRPVQPKTLLGTIKVIPFSVPAETLGSAERIAAAADLVSVKPFVVRRALLITTGSEPARDKVIGGFGPPLRDRLASYNTTMDEGPFVAEDERAISQALRQALAGGAEMILVAGETSIMDTNDITPRAIRAVGGEIVHHGVPVEPGNLLLLAYCNEIPIVGAPGCARSKSYNVVDMVLPRLAAGEHLTRRDLIELGHGGYLKH
jgi:molybdopterin biosynthesis enzyme